MSAILGYRLVKEAADDLGVSEQRIRQLTKNGKLPSQKVGPALLIPIEAITARKQAREVAKRKSARRARKQSNGNGHK
jgi:excisionase family DNA binding protein